ncbi:glycosyltransferase family 4 protein [Kitasatospora phosalacinea]|uniref:D-inositol 3-phosphate glycosyltransferase n=2 Tax=Kitasatospora phosalacinea TaxID=2065 RepID=A0ABW6GRN4_9ACTN
MVHSMLRALVARGHDVQVWLTRYGYAQEAYDVDGVQVFPLSARLDAGTALKQAHVVISHLENVPSTAALSRGFGRPLAVICHNTFAQTFRDIAAGGTALVVYNSLWMQREADLYFAERPAALRPADTMVVRPPVYADDYRTKPGRCVTLVNCNPEKGGRLLETLARRMPDTRFLAVTGAYGEQVLPDLPNVEIVGHMSSHQMREQVYSRTRVLLMPSLYESWGRAGVEAMASGIPVIAHPTPGLCESLGEAGLFADRNEPEAWAAILRRLETAAEYRLASKRAKARSAELDPTAELAAWCERIEALA